jgi:hypothetical protein
MDKDGATITQEKQRLSIHQFSPVAYPSAYVMVANGQVNDENIIGYEFYNYSNVPVTINGMFLDRYYAGSKSAPTYFFNRSCWIPNIQPGEIDTTIYTVTFLDTYYGDIAPNHNLIIMKKGLSRVMGNKGF